MSSADKSKIKIEKILRKELEKIKKEAETNHASYIYQTQIYNFISSIK